MCGLVLVITKRTTGFTSQQRDIFDELLFIDTFRGDDSTGAFVVSNIGNVSLAKEATEAPAFMRTDAYGKLRTEAFQNGWAMVGHNRKATRGTITDENAHPFVVDNNIVLVHNGSFNGDHKHIKDTNVDSEAIAHALHEEVDPELALRKINAAYALIWYNVDKKQMHVVRNTMRPLWCLETNDEYVFASEKPFLQFVIDRHKLQPTEPPYELKELTLCTYTLKENRQTTETTRELDCSFWKHNDVQTGGRSAQSFQESADEHEKRWQNALACGWVNSDDVSDVPFVEVKKPTGDTSIINKLMEAIYPNQTSMKYSDWFKIKDMYAKKQRIKVLVNDMIEADDDPKTQSFIMIGRTLDHNRVYVTFPFKEKNFDTVLESADSSVFEVEVDNCVWRRTDAYKPGPTKAIEDFEGISVIHASNPVPIYVEKIKNVVAH